MSEYNPNTTPTKGLEWFPVLAPAVTLDSATRCAAMSVLQTAAQVTANERVYVGEIPTREGLYVLEVYDNEDAVATGVATLTARPNEDVSGTGGTTNLWREDDGTTTTIYSEIDEATLDLADYIYNGPYGSSGQTSYVGRMDTAALALTGQRILAVQLRVIAGNDAPNYFGNFRGGLNIGGTNYEGFYGAPATVPATTTFTGTWYYNPSTSKPWTIADVQAFDSTDEWYVTPDIGLFTQVSRVYQAYLEVVVCAENRLAVGTLNDAFAALTPDAWNTVAVLTPTGGAWTKDGAGRHLYALRRLTSYGALVLPELDSGTAPNPARTFAPTLDPAYGYVTAMGAALSPVWGLVQRTSAPADSVDSQPYVLPVAAKVYNGQNAEQEFSNAGASTYAQIKARVKPNSATGSLLLKVKRRSDNVQFGTTITVTVAEIAALADLGNGWKTLDKTMSAGGLLAVGTQYYVEFSDATAADDGTGVLYWSVLTLDVGDATTGVTAGFGGTTDRGTINGAEADRYDIPATFAIVPTPPTNFASTVQTQALTGDGTGCSVDFLHYRRMTWTATALGASFLQYDIDRSINGGTTWERVAKLTTEATVAWNDYEVPRGVAVSYRARSVRTDGAASDWTASTTATISPQSCEWLFVSNADPTLNLGFDQNGPFTTYDLLDADDVTFMQAYERDYQIALRETELRGVAFRLPIVVQLLSTGPQGLQAFDALRSLVNADLPYVCVLDPYGNRFFADVEAPTADRRGTSRFHLALLDITQATTTSYIDTA